MSGHPVGPGAPLSYLVVCVGSLGPAARYGRPCSGLNVGVRVVCYV